MNENSLLFFWISSFKSSVKKSQRNWNYLVDKRAEIINTTLLLHLIDIYYILYYFIFKEVIRR